MCVDMHAVCTLVSLAEDKNGIEIQMYCDPAGSAIPHPRLLSSGLPVLTSPTLSLKGPFPMYLRMR